MSRRIQLLPLLLLLVLLAALLLRGVVRQVIIVPALYAWWIAGLLYRSIPQAILWALFMVGAALVLSRSLLHKGSPAQTPDEDRAERPGPVQDWVRCIERATSRYYSRWRFARRLAELTQDILVYQEQLTQRQAREIIEGGQLEAPAEVRAYLQAGRRRHFSDRFSELQYLLRWGTTSSPLEFDPEQIVQYLERQLEVRRDDPYL